MAGTVFDVGQQAKTAVVFKLFGKIHGSSPYVVNFWVVDRAEHQAGEENYLKWNTNAKLTSKYT